MGIGIYIGNMVGHSSGGGQYITYDGIRYLVWTLPDGTLLRKGVRLGFLVIDQTLTALGFGVGGVENTDWVNISAEFAIFEDPTVFADLNFYVEAGTRNGLVLPDTVNPGAGDAAILPSVAQFNTSGAAVLALTNTITFVSGEIIIHALQPTTTTAGGLLYGGSGTDFIQLRTNTSIGVRFSSTLKSFTVANLSLTAINVIRVVVTAVGTTKIRVYCNGVESSSGEQDCAALKNFVFNILASGNGICQMSYVKVTNNGTNVLEMHLTGAGNGREYDESGANNTGNWTGLVSKSVFRSDGTQYLLDSGYSIYTNMGLPDLIVPAGGYCSVAGYVLSETILGSATKHNLAPSMIQMSNAVWDRSDVTIWSDLARAGFYDATDANTKKQWHSTELNQDNISYWLNAGYKDLVFTKFEDNTIGTGRMLEEIFSYNTAKTGYALITALNYTGYIYDKFDNGKMVIGLDGSTPYVHDALAIFIAKGMNGTIYPIVEEVGTNPALYMSMANLIAWKTAGMDVQDHPLTDNTGLTVAQVIAAYQNADSIFAANGFTKPEHTAYMAGVYDANVLTAVATIRQTGRGAAALQSVVYRKTKLTNIVGNRYILPAINIGTEATIAGFKVKMLAAKNNRSALISYFHGIDSPLADNGLTQAELEEVADYAVTIGLDIVFHSALWSLMEH